MPALKIGSTVYSCAENPSGNATSTIVTLPSGIAVGDLLVVVGCTYGYMAYFSSVPSGWTQRTGGTVVESSGGQYATTLVVWTKVATAADVSAGNGGTFGSYNNYAGVATPNYEMFHASAYRGPGITVDAQAGDGTAYGAASPTTTPSLTSTKYGDYLLFASAASPGNGVATPATNYTLDLASSGGGPRLTSSHRTAATGAPGSYGGEGYTSVQRQANAVLAIYANNAPTGPSWTSSPAEGATLDRTAAQAVSWVHNDPDGDAQTAWDLRYRPAGSAGAWATISGTGSTPTASFPANTMAGKLELNVRTYDTSSAQGAWSVLRHLNFLDPSIGTASTAPTRLDPLAVLAMHAALQAGDTAATALAAAAGVSGTLTPATLGIYKATGSYVGDDTAGRVISVGFTPDLILVTGGSGVLVVITVSAAIDAYIGGSGATTTPPGTIISGGFNLGPSPASTNAKANGNGLSYAWTAFKFV